MNNKMIKGSVAGAAGIALLMGGFGTYALWSDAETMAGDSITAGTLDVAAGNVTWADNATPANTATGNDWNTLVVPGDKVTRTQTFTFSGTGKNLKGAIVFAKGGATEPSNPAGGGSAADAFSVKVALSGLSLTEVTPDCWEFTNANVGQTVTSKVDYELKADNQDLQGATASIANSTFTITQNATCS